MAHNEMSVVFPTHINTTLTTYNMGPALTAVWSKASPLTARCLSPCMGSNPGLGLCESCQ